MTRHELRESLFKLIFRIEFHETETIPEQMQIFLDGMDEEQDKDVEYIKEKFENVMSHMDEIDLKINEISDGWKTSRMAKVDLAIIRLAVYEVLLDTDVPTGVAINEAVELAKQFGTDDSPSFVNGVLAKIA